MTSICSKSEKG